MVRMGRSQRLTRTSTSESVQGAYGADDHAIRSEGMVMTRGIREGSSFHSTLRACSESIRQVVANVTSSGDSGANFCGVILENRKYEKA